MAGHTRNVPNSTSNHDPKHYQETLARGVTEADDEGCDPDLQLRPPSDQVLTGADAKRLRNLDRKKNSRQSKPSCRITPELSRRHAVAFGLNELLCSQLE